MRVIQRRALIVAVSFMLVSLWNTLCKLLQDFIYYMILNSRDDIVMANDVKNMFTWVRLSPYYNV